MAENLGSALVFNVGGSALEEVVSVAFSYNVNAVDATSNDDSGNKVYLAGDLDATCTVTCNYDPGGSEQDTIRTNSLAKTTTAFTYLPDGAGETYTFNGIITSVSVDGSHEEVVQMVVEIQITGGVTES